IPAAFSSTSPPPFLQAPLTNLLCRLAGFLDYNGIQKPDWLHVWTDWRGVGHRGEWGFPETPHPDDSRGPCPALNAMASHGILPSDGRGITPQRLIWAVSRTFNLSPTLAWRMVTLVEPLYRNRGQFDLEDLCAHGLLEHDASLLRPDFNSKEQMEDPTAQTHPWKDLIEALEVKLNREDFCTALTSRRIQCSNQNGQYYLNIAGQFFSSAKCSLVVDLRPLLGGTETIHFVGHARLERKLAGIEHMPLHRWQPCNRHYFGLTVCENMLSTILMEMGTGLTDKTK
ncbi:Cloroperoxidase, partial [Violaceomyces palustris]